MRRVVLASALALLGPAIARGQDAPPPPSVNPAELRAPAAPGGLTDAQLAQVEAIVERAVLRATDRHTGAQTTFAAPQAAAAPLPTLMSANRVTVVVPPGPIKRAAAATGDALTRFANKPRTRTMLLATPAQITASASPQR